MRILIFGDSITQGFNDTEQGGWCNRLFIHAMQRSQDSDHHTDVTVFNLGVSGDTTEDIRERLPVELAARSTSDPANTVVVFAVGVNDSYYELATGENNVSYTRFTENLSACFATAHDHAAQVFALTLLPIDEAILDPIPWKPTHGYASRFVEYYDTELQRVAGLHAVSLIDVRSALGDDPTAYLPDGIHPNAAGHERVFAHVRDALVSANIL